MRQTRDRQAVRSAGRVAEQDGKGEMGRGADVMIGFRSARSVRQQTDGAARSLAAGSDRTEHDRPLGQRLVGVIGEIGAAIATPRGGSSGERR